MSERGVFITFEGPEGSGKSTQVHALAAWLRRQGHRVLTLREPGGTPLGEALRRILLSPKTGKLNPRSDAFLYMAARAELVDAVILPALQRGVIVICDRFLDSTLAYQGYGSGVNVQALRRMGRLATRRLSPDLTMLLDLPPSVGLRRVRGARDRIERRATSFHARVRRGFLTLARREPRRFRVIDARQPRAAIQQRVRQVVKALLSRRRR